MNPAPSAGQIDGQITHSTFLFGFTGFSLYIYSVFIKELFGTKKGLPFQAGPFFLEYYEKDYLHL